MPRDKWQTASGLRKDAVNVLYGYNRQCHLAARAAVEFAGKGYPVMELDGGFAAWKEHDLEIESELTAENRMEKSRFGVGVGRRETAPSKPPRAPRWNNLISMRGAKA